MTLGEYAARVDGAVRGDAATRIDRIAAIDDADASTLTFAVDERYLRSALVSRAAAVLTETTIVEALGDVASRKPLLVVSSVRIALATLLADLEPPRARGPFRDPTASVDPTAQIGPDVHIGPFVSVAADAKVGAESVLLAGAVVGAAAVVGRGCTLAPRAMLLERCRIGDRVILGPGCVVGSEGFGYAFFDGRFVKIPQVGDVVLGDDVEVGANTTIDRAQTGSTTIGDGTKLDNLVQIGHNCQIGKHCAFAAMVGIAGSTKVGDYTVMGGQTGVNGHIVVGARVRAAGGSNLWRDVPDGMTVSGQPARDHRAELRGQVYLRNLGRLYERVDALERHLK